MQFLKQLFCNHKYNLLGTIPCTFDYGDEGGITGCPIRLFECEQCKQRMVIRDEDFMYKSSLLEEIELWRKGQLDYIFQDDKIYYGRENDKGN